MDCMELLAQIPDGYVSLILTDPPYGISYQNNFTKRKHRVLTGDEGMDYGRFAKESCRILKENSHAYFFTRFDCYPYHYHSLFSPISEGLVVISLYSRNERSNLSLKGIMVLP